MLAGDDVSSAVSSSTDVFPWRSSSLRISLARLSVFEDMLTACGWIQARVHEPRSLYESGVTDLCRDGVQSASQLAHIGFPHRITRQIVGMRPEHDFMVPKPGLALEARAQGGVHFAHARGKYDDSALRGLNQTSNA